jgi:hypothetical protein
MQWFEPVAENLPRALTDRHQWVMWRGVWRAPKWTKPPYQIDGCLASTSDPLTWDRFEHCESAWSSGRAKWDGYGFVLSADDPYCGIDLDHCRNPETGKIEDWALGLLCRFNSYSEPSPSGSGIHIFIKGKLPGTGRRKGHIEIYDCTRFLTITGRPLQEYSSTIEQRQDVLDAVFKELFPDPEPPPRRAQSPLSLSDEAVVELASNAKNGARFLAVYRDGETGGDHSRADFNLMCSLLFWCGGDTTQAMRIFWNSALAQRSKWRDREDYREHTLNAAVRQVSDFYHPPQKNNQKVHVNGHDAASNGSTDQNNQRGPRAEVKESKFEEPVPFDQWDLQELPRDILPPAIENMVEAVAAFTETPPELALFGGLGSISTCTQGKFVIEARPGHQEPLNLWVMAALESGNRKTAVMDAMTKPFVEYEREQSRQLAPAIVAATQEYTLIQKRIEHFEKKAAAAIEPAEFESLKQQIQDLRKTLPLIPKPTKLREQDITIEKLAPTLAENDGRISIISDEGGIFDILGGLYNSTGSANLDVFLQAHSGSQIRVSRHSRPSVDVPNPALTMALSPQPSVIQGLAAKRHFRGRGLLARPLYALPVSRLGSRSNNGPPVSPGIIAAYHNCLHTILRIEPRRDEAGDIVPFVLKLSDQAQEIWHDFQQQIESEMREDGRLAHLTDWAGKLPGQLLRIAGNLQIAMFPSTILAELTVTDDIMRKVVRLGMILIPHALAVFGLMAVDTDVETAKKIWRHIEKRRVLIIRERQPLQWLKSSIKTMEPIRAGLTVLVERGFLEELNILRTSPGRGRPHGITYQVCDFYKSQWR